MIRTSTFLLTFIVLIVSSAFASPAADLKPLFPKSGEMSGWKYKGDVRVFANNKLWEYIDGGADVYLDYGFIQVATIEFVNDKRSFVADIYEFKSTEGAFGMYARERAPTYHFIKIGGEGYHEGISLNFYQAKYYVKLSAFSDDKPTSSALLACAEIVSKRIGGKDITPAGLALLPAGQRVAHSESFEMKSYLNRTELRQSFSARYNLGGKQFTAFVCATESQTNAQARLKGLTSAFTPSAKHDKALQGIGDAFASGVHREVKEIVVVQKGKYLFGVHSFGDAASAIQFLKTITKILSR